MTDNDAIEARSLLQNDLLTALFDRITEDARDTLVSLDADDAGAIRDQQALCRAVNEIRARLAIMARPTREPPSVA